jgi:hypothetical protein
MTRFPNNGVAIIKAAPSQNNIKIEGFLEGSP